jgi:hypothetical protein
MRNSWFNLGRLKALIEKSQRRRLVPQQKDAMADVASWKTASEYIFS